MLVKLKTAGFTLVELAMVLFIVGLLLGGLLVPLSTKLEQESRTRTLEQMTEIKESMLGFAVINGRLPCPDCPDGVVGSCNAVAAANRNDGMEDRVGVPLLCATNVGNLPWVGLQVPEFDAWNRHYTYRVTPNFSRDSNTAPCGTPALGVSFELCTSGDITIYSDAAQTQVLAQNVPAVVVSHGADGYEPVQTAQQVENYDRNPVNPSTGASILTTYAGDDANVFIYMDYSRDSSLDPPTQFDDLVMWLSPNLLMNRMIVSGRLP